MKSRYEVFISVNIVIRRDYETSRVTEKKQIEQIEVQKWRIYRRTGNPAINIRRIAGQGNSGENSF
jgi:hypothetical protein